MLNLLFIFFLQGPCKPCCSKPPTSPANCIGDLAKCIDCLSTPAASIEDYIFILFIIAISYGMWVLYKHNSKKTF
ncbi:MAG: hypothetical protein V3V28_09640 [Polaribacter sp.]|uniref:hypothetical protein n=1 Tax=Polaribacter sp. TaxID=1920175 RepID=UPI002F35CBDC